MRLTRHICLSRPRRPSGSSVADIRIGKSWPSLQVYIIRSQPQSNLPLCSPSSISLRRLSLIVKDVHSFSLLSCSQSFIHPSFAYHGSSCKSSIHPCHYHSLMFGQQQQQQQQSAPVAQPGSMTGSGFGSGGGDDPNQPNRFDANRGQTGHYETKPDPEWSKKLVAKLNALKQSYSGPWLVSSPSNRSESINFNIVAAIPRDSVPPVQS